MRTENRALDMFSNDKKRKQEILDISTTDIQKYMDDEIEFIIKMK